MADHTVGAGEPGRRFSVKAGLTPNRRRRRVENDEYASFIPRVIRAHAKRAAVRLHQAKFLVPGQAAPQLVDQPIVNRA